MTIYNGFKFIKGTMRRHESHVILMILLAVKW